MSFRSKRPKSQPYGSECVGALSGSFTPSCSVRSIRFFDPIGKAVEDFSKGVLGELWALLQASLPESNVSVVIVLYMIGYTRELAKPTITFVSQDKRLRKQAFDLVKGSGILQKYPGFEVANIPKISEFELFGKMAGSENDGRRVQGQVHSSTPLAVFTTRRGNLHGRRLMVYKETGKEQSPAIATAGGIVSYGGQYMFHTVNHILDELQPEKVACGRDDCGDEDDEDDFEITGLSDHDEPDEEADDFIDATSSGSMTPESAQSDVDLSESNFSSSDTPGPLEPFNTIQCRSGDLANDISAVTEPQQPADEITRAGETVWASRQGDSLFLSIGTEVRSDPCLDDKSLEEQAIPLENFSAYVEPGPRRAAVKVPTPNGTIGGTLSTTPSSIRLPGSKKFEEVYLARFNRPLAVGDCGSWVHDAVTDKLFGHVIAGSPKSGLIMIMPAHRVFRRVLGALSATPPPNLPSSIADSPHLGTAIKSNETDNLKHRAIDSNPQPRGRRIHNAPEANVPKSNFNLAFEGMLLNELYGASRTNSFVLNNSRDEDTGENEPYIVGLQRFGFSEDVVSLFMSALCGNYPCQFQKDYVVGFCAGADMQNLENTAGGLKVSLLDDTNDEGCSSLYGGGLTAFDLYKALRRPHLSHHKVKLDPFTAGETTSHAALREPREYFLQVLAVRLGIIRREWEDLVLYIEEAISTYMSDYWERLAQIESSSNKFHNWIKMTTALLRELINTIQKYECELDLFFYKGVHYFHGFTHSTNVSGPAIVSLTTIDRVRGELRQLSRKLQNLKDNLTKDILREVIMSPISDEPRRHGLQDQVSLRLAHENNKSTLSQQAAGRDLRVLTWITFVAFSADCARCSTAKQVARLRPHHAKPLELGDINSDRWSLGLGNFRCAMVAEMVASNSQMGVDSGMEGRTKAPRSSNGTRRE
ncbi:hypothetical protein DL767_007703 [Monosporascus sp. MG133]|nr:hypothetical protein DL767_007703 [Monosporascus sp. MG133]